MRRKRVKKKKSFKAVCCECGTTRKTTFNMAAAGTTILRCDKCCNLTKHTLITDMEEDW